MIIIVDSNILFSALIRDSTTRKLIYELDQELITPEIVFYELNKGEEYVFFSVERNSVERKEVQLMFKSIHAKRDERGITARGIAQPELKAIYYKDFDINNKYNIKFHELTLNQGITIGKNRIIIESAYPEPFAVEIISQQTAKSYREFFEKIWKTAEK